MLARLKVANWSQKHLQLALLEFASRPWSRTSKEMEQKSEERATQSVNQLVLASKDTVDISDDYNDKAGTVLGVVYIILGLVAVLFSGLVNPIVRSYSVPAILTLGIFFIISGGLAIAGAKTVNRRQVVATIVLALINTITAGFLFLCVHEGEPVFSLLLIAMAEVMLLTTIVLRPLSMYCSSNK